MRAAVLMVLGLGCADAEKGGGGEDSARAEPLRLRWVRGYEGDTLDRSLRGLWWQLSQLGARPPADGGALIAVEVGEDRALFELDLGALGLSEEARAPLERAILALEGSDEQRIFGGVDLGRFLLRTVNDPWLYYAVSGACPTLEDWEAAKLREPWSFAVNDSLLTAGDRLVRFNPDPGSAEALAFVAAAGEGTLAGGDFAPAEHETLDLMPNGQQRFAAYDEEGALSPAIPGSPAGQPGRCMWCHEGDTMPLSPGNTAVSGYVDPETFARQLALTQARFDETRSGQTYGVDWGELEQHAWGELLVETFLAPSPERLAREWGIDASTVEARLEDLGLPRHESEEYPEQGLLFTRADLDAALPELSDWLAAHTEIGLDLAGGYAALPALSSARALDTDELGLLFEAAPEELRCAPPP